MWHSRHRLCSVEERPFRAVKRNPGKILFLASAARAQPQAEHAKKKFPKLNLQLNSQSST
jgi:hypothetical protein